jgi:hypothetical protein
MRNPIEIPPYYAVLIVCTMTLVALVYAEGWIWPLKAAACMIPVRSSSCKGGRGGRTILPMRWLPGIAGVGVCDSAGAHC